MNSPKIDDFAKAMAKRPNNVCQTFRIHFTSNVWTVGDITKHCLSCKKQTEFVARCLKNFKSFFVWRKQKMWDEQCFATWPNGKTFWLTSKLQCLTNIVRSFGQRRRFLPVILQKGIFYIKICPILTILQGSLGNYWRISPSTFSSRTSEPEIIFHIKLQTRNRNCVVDG